MIQESEHLNFGLANYGRCDLGLGFLIYKVGVEVAENSGLSETLQLYRS